MQSRNGAAATSVIHFVHVQGLLMSSPTTRTSTTKKKRHLDLLPVTSPRGLLISDAFIGKTPCSMSCWWFKTPRRPDALEVEAEITVPIARFTAKRNFKRVGVFLRVKHMPSVARKVGPVPHRETASRYGRAIFITLLHPTYHSPDGFLAASCVSAVLGHARATDRVYYYYLDWSERVFFKFYPACSHNRNSVITLGFASPR